MDAILIIVFWLYLGAFLANQREIRSGDEESHANRGHMTITAFFPNSRRQKAAILETVCCKGDASSQWEMTILGVSELCNP